MFVDFLKHFKVLNVVFGFMVDELKDFKDFSLALGMLSTTISAANLPKGKTLKYHQKLRF
jgi:hypothetical protein